MTLPSSLAPFSQRVITLLQSVPYGRVATYGAIAAAAGSPRAARQVVRLLHACSDKYQLPWHRIVNRDGEIVLSDEASRWRQARLLEAEGVSVDARGRVDLPRFGWQPPG
ncbi:DNA methyltransferase [Pseudomaricurvus sp. HS19]|nr:MGMT family protein [Pseudomaricurvus sp. HS19]MYM64103.1 DNA methyltransferase [Pseudomaricurvus sp. HS19]